MIEVLGRGGPAFLASVTSAEEAAIALRGGADVIDCKDPATGALGALDVAIVRDIVTLIAGRVPVSATVGDLPAEAAALVPAALAMAAAGVDIVKIGFFGEGDARAAIAALGGERLGHASLVAVLMAERNPDLTLLPVLAVHGFTGVMLDTADKAVGSLTTALSEARLLEFLRAARQHSLFAGLAGSLSVADIAGLSLLKPDVLGFRGALCASGRKSSLETARVTAVKREIDRCQTSEMTLETSVA